MPRSRPSSGRKSFDQSLRVEVLVQDERLLISCGRGQDTVEWLLHEVAGHYADCKTEGASSKVQGAEAK